MAKYQKVLQQWVANQLITEAQAKAISEFESRKPSSMLFGFLALGAAIIGLGCISIIAANWKDIPDLFKLTLDFAILFATSWFALREAKTDRFLRYEGLLVFLMIFTLASIGLIAQVFHTRGELYQAFLFWSVITSGIMLASKKILVPLIWSSGFLGSLVVFSYDSAWGKSIFGHEPTSILASLPFLVALCALISRLFLGEGPQTKAFRFWVVVCAVIGMASMEVGGRPDRITSTARYLQFGLVALTAVFIGVNREYRWMQKVLLWATTIFYLLPFQFHWIFGEISSYAQKGLLFSSTTLITLGTFAVFCATIDRKKLVNLCLNLMGLRFLVLYFQALGGLAYTGWGLIFSGVLIMGMVVIWSKKRNAIERFVEGLAK